MLQLINVLVANTTIIIKANDAVNTIRSCKNAEEIVAKLGMIKSTCVKMNVYSPKCDALSALFAAVRLHNEKESIRVEEEYQAIRRFEMYAKKGYANTVWITPFGDNSVPEVVTEMLCAVRSQIKAEKDAVRRAEAAKKAALTRAANRANNVPTTV